MEPSKREEEFSEGQKPRVEMGRKRKKKRRKHQLDWGEGLFRWTSFQAEHGTGIVPDNHNDKELLQWVQDQRVDYWKMKAGKSSFLDEHGFGMLTRRGFDWGDNPHQNLGEERPKKLKAPHKTKPKNPPLPAKVTPEKIKNIWDEGKLTSSRDDPEEHGDILRAEVTLSDHPAPNHLNNNVSSPPLSIKKCSSTSADVKFSELAPPELAVSGTKSSGANDAKRLAGRKSPPKVSSIAPGTITPENCPSTLRKDSTLVGSTGSLEGKGRPGDVSTEGKTVASEFDEKPDQTVSELEMKPAAEKTRPRDTSALTGAPERKKPRRNCRYQISAKELASLVDRKGDGKLHAREESNANNDQETERYPRRSTRSAVPDIYSDYSGFRRYSQPTASRPRARSTTKYCLLETTEFDGVRLLKKVPKPSIERLVPHEKEQSLFDEVICESPDLLICEEKLIFEKGDPYTTFRANVAWEQRFFEFLVFKKVYGHGLVPKTFPENEALRRWTKRNRSCRRNGDQFLSQSRIDRLDAAGFDWELDQGQDAVEADVQESNRRLDSDSWETKVQMLLDYKNRYGDCLVPCGYKENAPLALWVSNCRKQYKNKREGKRSTLTKKREKQLREIGFVFSLKGCSQVRKNVMLKAYQGRWEAKYKLLLKFRETYGHTAVPRHWQEDGSLGEWCHRQRCLGRRYLKGEKTAMLKERFERLRKVEFPFETCPQACPLDGIELEMGRKKDISTNRIRDSPVAPDIATSSEATVTPEACGSSPNYSIRRQESAEKYDACSETDRDVPGDDEVEEETEDDVTEADDSDNADQYEEHGDDDSFTASDAKGASETTRHGRRKDRRQITVSLRGTGSTAPESTADEVVPDGAVSCSVVGTSKSPNKETSAHQVKERNWSCGKCGKKGFEFFVEAMNHEAMCLGLQSLAIGPVTPLQ